MSLLKKIFGLGSDPLFEGAKPVTTMPKIVSYVEGFNVSISTMDKQGEYEIAIRSNGQNPEYPREEYPKIISLIKSPDQFNLAKTPLGCIAHDHNYSRIVVAVVPPSKVRSENFGWVELNRPKPELCVVAYIRSKDGVETLWAGAGIEMLMSRRPKSDATHSREKISLEGVQARTTSISLG